MLLVDRVSKSFGLTGDADTGTLALDDVSLSAVDGEFVTIIGPSGCGKSTLLSCIAGLLPYGEGRIEVDGVLVDGPGPGRAVVFQHASLLPWRNVLRNVMYGMELQRRVPSGEIENRARQMVEAVGLCGYEKFFPHQLSGGMRQRVNLARALATEPSTLLMDEPFGALDALTKASLQDVLLDLVQREKRMTVFITHDIEEAVFLGDQVVVMSTRPGRIVQTRRLPFGRPRDRSLTESAEFLSVVRELRTMLRPKEQGGGPMPVVAASVQPAT